MAPILCVRVRCPCAHDSVPRVLEANFYCQDRLFTERYERSAAAPRHRLHRCLGPLKSTAGPPAGSCATLGGVGRQCSAGKLHVWQSGAALVRPPPPHSARALPGPPAGGTASAARRVRAQATASGTASSAARTASSGSRSAGASGAASAGALWVPPGAAVPRRRDAM